MRGAVSCAGRGPRTARIAASCCHSRKEPPKLRALCFHVLRNGAPSAGCRDAMLIASGHSLCPEWRRILWRSAEGVRVMMSLARTGSRRFTGPGKKRSGCPVSRLSLRRSVIRQPWPQATLSILSEITRRSQLLELSAASRRAAKPRRRVAQRKRRGRPARMCAVGRARAFVQGKSSSMS
jgi:hypothetical protein